MYFLYRITRGVQEQHDLIPKQFVHFPQDISVYNSNVYYLYTEFISKTNQHRFKDLNFSGKVSRAYAQIDVEHCVVKLLDKYLSKLQLDHLTSTCVLLKNHQSACQNLVTLSSM